MKSLRAHSKARTHAKLARWMGGKTAPSKTEMGEDGKPKSKRAVSEPISVEGKAARPRLDRPGRKMGGRLKRADGGDVYKSPPNPGEVSDEQSEKYLRSKMADKIGAGALKSAGAGALLGTGIGSASSTKKIPQAGGKKFATGLGGLLIGAGLGAAKSGYESFKEGLDAGDEADKFKGKKSGGKVNK